MTCLTAASYRWNWVGMYAAGDPDLYNYLGLAYTDSQSSGSVMLDVDTLAELAPGNDVVRFMQDDWYSVMDETPFTIHE